LRADKETSSLVRRIRKQSRNASVNDDVGVTLAQAEVVNTDVPCTTPVDYGGHTMNFAKIGDHQGGKTVHCSVRFTDFEFAVWIFGKEKITARFGQRIKRDGRFGGKRICKAQASDNMPVADAGTSVYDDSNFRV
jgi:hypothetical protein